MRKIFSLFVIAVCLTALSCAGDAARTHVLSQAEVKAWPGVRADIEYGVQSSMKNSVENQEVKDSLRTALIGFEDSLLTGSPDYYEWTMLRQYALKGIDARVASGEIGPGVADSLRERVRLFDEAVEKGRPK